MAKLRMHTDRTLEIFDELTVCIGAKFREFNDKTCSAFDTRELRREIQARKRRQEKKSGVNNSKSAPAPVSAHLGADGSEGPRPKKFNLHTYKFHALGDYPETIRLFGTSDSYSTEPVSDDSL